MLQQNPNTPDVRIGFTAAILFAFIFPDHGMTQRTPGEAKPKNSRTDLPSIKRVRTDEGSSDTSEVNLEEKALRTGNMYAKSVSVHVVEYTVHMVRLTPKGESESTPEFIEYIFIWSGILEGGPLRINHALIRQRPKGATYVDVTRSTPIVDLDMPAMWVERIVDHSRNSVTVVGYRREEISETDLYDRRVFVKFTLTLTDQGDWKTSKGKQIRSEKIKRIVE